MADKRDLIREEQQILDRLIKRLDTKLMMLNRDLSEAELEAIKLRKQSSAEVYGELLDANDRVNRVRNEKRETERAKDELYAFRLIMDVDDGIDKDTDMEFMVGLHKYYKGRDIYVNSWLSRPFRDYVFGGTVEPQTIFVDNKRLNEQTKTVYTLKQMRRVDLRFATVEDVMHMFPALTEEEKQIIYDAFLEDLARRRKEPDFRNIVFSIQKKQSEIALLPYEKNIIIQGCAGSGKSMIMMHRLPIVLFDNKMNSKLTRNSIYIISPSQAYIAMAENMREELEISDLRMGTLKEYYDLLIASYDVSEDVYGVINPLNILSSKQEEYIYSSKFIEDMKRKMDKALAKGRADLDVFANKLNVNLDEGVFNTVISRSSDMLSYSRKILDDIRRLQRVIAANNDVLSTYMIALRETLSLIRKLQGQLYSRSTYVEASIRRMIDQNNQTIVDQKKGFDELKAEYAKEQRLSKIKYAQERLVTLNKHLKEIPVDEKYKADMRELHTEAADMLEIFKDFKGQFELNSGKNVYEYIKAIDKLVKRFNTWKGHIEKYKDPYHGYSVDLIEEVTSIVPYIEKLETIDTEYLTYRDFTKLKEKQYYYSTLSDTLVDELYHEVLDSLLEKKQDEGDKKSTRKKKLDAFACSPYVYLQLLYLYHGVPNRVKESLIAIDEAQNLAPVEIQLIQNVNRNDVILNLFGDENQHIEGSKGISNWKSIGHLAKFERYDMNENYRNAKQITEYCNRRFTMNMNPINLSGSGVREFDNREALIDCLDELLHAASNSERSAIIVKTDREAKWLKLMLARYSEKLNDMVLELNDIHQNKWNIMKIDSVKGLEFKTVVAVTGEMTRNEKYIAYTRALDKLYVYDNILVHANEVIPENEEKNDLADEAAEPKKATRRRERKAKDYSKSEVKMFFEKEGLYVKDERSEGGSLWVAGKREEIESYVNKAEEEFDISGQFVSKAKELSGGPGWFTKTKK